ncbi:MAG: TatD family hydrolase [Phycisphaerales bacterium]|nr:TatD family hydrolase [Phycisphaerales bacterium]
MLIDTHCHLTYDELAPQIDAVWERAAAAGVMRCITVGTDIADIQRGIALSATRPGIFHAAGIHPHAAGRANEEELRALEQLHADPAGSGLSPERLVAVGETGLDFHYDFAPRDVQEVVFRRQLVLAIRVRRPVVIHARESEERVCDVLAEYPVLRDRVVFHCFSGGPELARRALDMGFWLSFTGVVTFKNADAIRAAALLCPPDRMMVETDAPYLAPEPVRKIRPNEPAFVAHTARFLAALRKEDYAAFARATTANAERFFGLPATEE